MYSNALRILYSVLSCATPCTSILRLRHGTREGTGDEEGRRRRTTATSRIPDDVYDNVLSCAAPCTSILRLRHGTREGTGDEEGRRRRTTATSRSPDDVYGALSCADLQIAH